MHNTRPQKLAIQSIALLFADATVALNLRGQLVTARLLTACVAPNIRPSVRHSIVRSFLVQNRPRDAGRRRRGRSAARAERSQQLKKKPAQSCLTGLEDSAESDRSYQRM